MVISTRFRHRLATAFASHSVRSVSALVGGNFLGTAIGMVGTVVQARYVYPADLGCFRKLGIATGYASFLQLGLFGILQRDYPFLLGRGEKAEALHRVAVCQLWSVVVAAATAATFGAFGAWAMAHGDWRVGWAWLVQSVAAAGFMYGGFLLATFRSGQDFEHVAASGVVSQIASAVWIPLYCVAPFATLVLRPVVASATSAAYLHWLRPVRVRSVARWTTFWSMVCRGMPLFGAGYMTTALWSAVELSLVARYAGNTGVGLFAFALAIAEMLNKVPQAMNQVYMPRIAFALGKTSCVRSCIREVRRATWIGATGSGLAAVAGWCLAPAMIRAVMPRWVDATPVLTPLLLIVVITALQLPLYVLVVAQDLRAQYASNAVGYAVLALVFWALHRALAPTSAVAWGSIAGRGATTACSWAFVLSSTKIDGGGG